VRVHEDVATEQASAPLLVVERRIDVYVDHFPWSLLGPVGPLSAFLSRSGPSVLVPGWPG
jgi:hypothetical protein